MVRQVCAWGGGDRRTLGAVCRRRPQAGARTRPGSTGGERRGVWGRLQPPASQGAAACGTTRLEPRRPRRRAQRHRPVPPRRAVSGRAGPPADSLPLPGPALGEPAVGAAVQAPGREHQRQARPPSRRGAGARWPGVRPGPHGGEACDGTRLRPRARQGQPRADASSRGLGTAAYRCGGERLGQKTQVRTALVALAVWQAVGPWLPPPERLAEASRRRWPPETRATRTPLATREDQRSQGRQGVARRLDRDAESLLDQAACEPRRTRLRQRLARREAPRHALAAEAAVHGALPRMMGRREDGATQRHNGLETADGARKRDRIRALVKRVTVTRPEVNGVLRIDPYPRENDPEKKSWQLWRGRAVSPAGTPRTPRPRTPQQRGIAPPDASPGSDALRRCSGRHPRSPGSERQVSGHHLCAAHR